ncbi:hypothetical protein PROFUN_08743 [Planoprotostelium fungivorum]|uniref:VTT domain-containing protein n=1 Tax=Planoprotostelium fungivorum TaxID=1890364 RepID=A0A2P6ND47_9EUKA|nr:hypothetical protein PROFUN_08743 [Planoprotostelium fungivorum]
MYGFYIAVIECLSSSLVILGVTSDAVHTLLDTCIPSVYGYFIFNLNITGFYRTDYSNRQCAAFPTRSVLAGGLVTGQCITPGNYIRKTTNSISQAPNSHRHWNISQIARMNTTFRRDLYLPEVCRAAVKPTRQHPTNAPIVWSSMKSSEVPLGPVAHPRGTVSSNIITTTQTKTMHDHPFVQVEVRAYTDDERSKEMEVTSEAPLLTAEELEESSVSAEEASQQTRRKCSPVSATTVAKITAMLIVLAMGITLVCLLSFSNGARQVATNVLSRVSELPTALSMLLVSLLYALSLLFFCPGTPFNMLSGYLFGIWMGSLVAAGGCLLGAMISFLAGRTIARDWVKDQMKRHPSFEALDAALEDNGLYIVFLTRLSPLFPFPLLNYAFGSTKIHLWQYALGTFAGVLPSTIGYTYLGTLLSDLNSIWESGGSTRDYIIMGVGAIVTLISIVVISFITKRAIDRATIKFQRLDVVTVTKDFAEMP